MISYFTSFRKNSLAANPGSEPTTVINREVNSVYELLQENEQYDRSFNTSFSLELAHFLKFSVSMLVAFPLGMYMRKRIRKNKRLNYILQFNELQQVRNNIEKGSFAYDTILFKQSPLGLLKNQSHLANLVCLAILFGDEFIDGIAAVHGKNNIRQLLNDSTVNYYLRCKKGNQGYELYYEFDICHVLPEAVLEVTNNKYGITYRAFYSHLQFLLQEMNVYLNRLESEQAEEAARLICKVCNKCFDTYKSDINEFEAGYSLADLVRYQKTKDDDIIQVLLTLRAVLLNKKQLQYQKQFSSWSSMVRSMQLYDDMQDVPGDCNFQMNTVCFFARNFFSTEWHWLQQHKDWLQNFKGLELHSIICLNMPASCIITMQYARNIAHGKLSWVQRKIQNYLWRKNWLGFANRLLNEKGFCLSTIMKRSDSSIPLKFHFIKKQVMAAEHHLITEDMQWAHIFDIALMDEQLKLWLFKKLSFKQKYLLTSCFIEFPLKQKAAWVKEVLKGV